MLVIARLLWKNVMHDIKDPQVLWSGRNARTGHKLAICAVIKAGK